MSRFTDRLRRLESRRNPDPRHIVMFWDDGTPVTAGGMTLAEYQAAYPDSTTVCMTWGDDDDLKLLPVISGLAQLEER